MYGQEKVMDCCDKAYLVIRSLFLIPGFQSALYPLAFVFENDIECSSLDYIETFRRTETKAICRNQDNKLM